MDLADVTVLVLTYNEEANIVRTIDAVGWAGRVVIVDSGSTDGTRGMAARAPNVTWIERPFDSHAAQWNFGLSQVETEWTLAIDADHVCPPGLAGEIGSLSGECDGYEAAFTYVVRGRPLRASLYPPRVVLFRTRVCRYVQDGHTQRLVTGSARIGRLTSRIAHDDRKPRARWLESQRRYAALEADRLMTVPARELVWTDRLRLAIVCAPIAVPIFCLLVRGLVLDGWAGVSYTLERTCAELILSMELVDRRLAGASRNARGSSNRPS